MLISLPLAEVEKSWFVEFLEDGKESNLPGPNDTSILQAIGSGRAESVSDPKTRNCHKINGVD